MSVDTLKQLVSSIIERQKKKKKRKRGCMVDDQMCMCNCADDIKYSHILSTIQA